MPYSQDMQMPLAHAINSSVHGEVRHIQSKVYGAFGRGPLLLAPLLHLLFEALQGLSLP